MNRLTKDQMKAIYYKKAFFNLQEMVQRLAQENEELREEIRNKDKFIHEIGKALDDITATINIVLRGKR